MKIKRAEASDTMFKEKGVYRVGINYKNEKTASMSCPDCGFVKSLSGHAINIDGIVVPSVVCSKNDCKFNEFVELEGWKIWVK